MPDAHCCEAMSSHLAHGSLHIRYWPRYREYGITYNDSGPSIQLIHFCPWCGSKLPGSVRDEYFDALDRRGLEPGDPGIPAEFKTEEWWRKRGL